ncbi:hypothetical protein [Promicromonospora sp. NFX87]|uniref:hypothetical protein n=1 Tax=Promicromonospora sp. NFX87 TaxID=3402691 RepID=UPI003AFB7649
MNELIKLREGEGLSSTKLEKAPAILALRATKDEMARGGEDVGAEPIAAERMLRCAVRRLLPRFDYGSVLHHTLNIAGTDTILKQRRSDLKKRLNTEGTTYDRLEKRAYAEFAKKVTWAPKSPCGIATPSREEEADAAIEVLKEMPDTAIAVTLAVALLRQLPHGARAVNHYIALFPHNDSTPAQAAVVLIGRVILARWPSVLGSDPEFRLIGSIDRFFDANFRATHTIEEIERAVIGEEQGVDSTAPLVDDQGEPSVDFYLRVSVSLRVLAALMISIEDEHDWNTVFPNSGFLAKMID